MEGKKVKTKMSNIVKAYIDTNILIDYCWQNYFGEGMSEAMSTRLMNKGFERRFDIYFSTFSLIELSIHFRDWFLLQKVIKGGFSYAEFKRERPKYSLSSEEREKISYILNELKNNENINFIEIAGMQEEFLNYVLLYVENYIEFFDAIHSRIAIDTACDYFITKDGELRKRLQNLISQQKITEPIKITTVSGFLNQIK